MPISDDKIAAFIRRWSQAESSERANYALFLTELCDVLEVSKSSNPSKSSAACIAGTGRGCI
jgi:hypothetical protein